MPFGDTYLLLTLLLRIILIMLLLGLLKIYIQSYKKIKIGYTAGLVLFSSILLVRSIYIISTIIYLLPFDIILYPPMLFDTVIELVAIAILYKITRDN